MLGKNADNFGMCQSVHLFHYCFWDMRLWFHKSCVFLSTANRIQVANCDCDRILCHGIQKRWRACRWVVNALMLFAVCTVQHCSLCWSLVLFPLAAGMLWRVSRIFSWCVDCRNSLTGSLLSPFLYQVGYIHISLLEYCMLRCLD